MTERHLYLYEYVNAPFDSVAKALAEDPAGLLQTATDVAAEHARKVHAELVVDLAGFEVGRRVVIDVGRFEPTELRRSKVHLSWRAAELSALFPALEAELEVAALAFQPPLTQVSMIATYRPPLGPLGAAADAVWGHRIAEAAVHRFLDDVVARLEDRLQRQDRPHVGAV